MNTYTQTTKLPKNSQELLFDKVMELQTLIGGTPLVSMPSQIIGKDINLNLKLEFMNITNSVKVRPALNMIRKGVEKGEILFDTVIVESSSGNLAVALSFICNFIGLKFVCAIDDKTSDYVLKVLRSYGTSVIKISEKDSNGIGYLKNRIKAMESFDKNPKYHWVNQYRNTANSEAYDQLVSESIEQLGTPPDYIFVAVSSFGAYTGIKNFIRANNLPSKVVAVDSFSSVLLGQPTSISTLPGFGGSFIANTERVKEVDEFVRVSEEDCILWCNKLIKKTGFFCGASSGGVLAAISNYALKDGAVCLGILADSGEKYLDTVYHNRQIA